MLMFEYFVSKNVCWGSLAVQRAYMSQHIYCKSVFWVMIFILPNESTRWPAHFVAEVARKIKLDALLIDSCVSMTSFVDNEACLWKANTATLIAQTDSFFLSVLKLTSSTSFQFSICNLIVFKFFSTSCNQFPSLHPIWCKILSISVGVKLFKYIFYTTFVGFHEGWVGEGALVLHQIVIWDSFWHGGVCYTPSTIGKKSLCFYKKFLCMNLFRVDKDLPQG